MYICCNIVHGQCHIHFHSNVWDPYRTSHQRYRRNTTRKEKCIARNCISYACTIYMRQTILCRVHTQQLFNAVISFRRLSSTSAVIKVIRVVLCARSIWSASIVYVPRLNIKYIYIYYQVLDLNAACEIDCVWCAVCINCVQYRADACTSIAFCQCSPGIDGDRQPTMVRVLSSQHKTISRQNMNNNILFPHRSDGSNPFFIIIYNLLLL